MKINCTLEDLRKALSIVGPVIGKTESAGIMTTIKLECEGGNKIVFTSTSRLLTAREPVEAEVSEEGTVCIPGKRFHDIVKELEGEVVDMQMKDDLKMTVKCGGSKFILNCLDPKDYPVLAESDDAAKFLLEADALKSAIPKVLFAAASDAEQKYALRNVAIRVEKGHVDVVTTDGHRLAIVESELAEKVADRTYLIDKKAADEFCKFLVRHEHPEIIADKSRITAFADGSLISVLLSEGEYPKYKDLLKFKIDKTYEDDCNVMLHILKRISIMSTKGKGVLFKFLSKSISASAVNPDYGEVVEKMKGDFKGDPINIIFNGDYFSQGLQVIDNESFTFHLGTDTTPGLVRSGKDDGFTYLIMPMRNEGQE